MRGLAQFLGANLFLLGMLAAGVAVVVVLVRLAQLAGADAEVLVWLYWPIGVAGILATVLSGKFAHKALTRLL